MSITIGIAQSVSPIWARSLQSPTSEYTAVPMTAMPQSRMATVVSLSARV